MRFNDFRKVEGKVVAVAWKDAHHSTDEVMLEEIEHRPTIYVTAGILVKSSDEGVTLSLDLNESGGWRGRTFVPREMIVEEWEVGQLRPKQRRKKTKPAKEASLPPEG